MRSLPLLCIYFSISTWNAFAKPTLRAHDEPDSARVFLNLIVEKGPASISSSFIINPAIQDCLLIGHKRHEGQLPLPLILRGKADARGGWSKPWVRGGGWSLNRCLEKALPGLDLQGQVKEGEILRIRVEKGTPGSGILLKPKSVKILE